jgi:hypothetical protein
MSLTVGPVDLLELKFFENFFCVESGIARATTWPNFIKIYSKFEKYKNFIKIYSKFEKYKNFIKIYSKFEKYKNFIKIYSKFEKLKH